MHTQQYNKIIKQSMERVLPEEIILHIFVRVPFESVCECRLVSKTWKHFISHLSKVNTPPSDSKISFIFLNMLPKDKVQLLSLEYDNNNEQPQSQLRISKMNHPLISRDDCKSMSFGITKFWEKKSVIIGSSNGLICLSIPIDGRYGAFNDPLYICNPVTREYILLPICGEKCRRNVFGFGYNDKTNEYKVVRISYESDEHTEPGQVQVYTIGAGTGWRNKGEIAYSLQTNNSHSPGVHADGEIYWLHQKILPWKAEVPGKLMKSNFDRIVAFNLADEVFRLLPMLPDYPLLPGDPNFALPCYYRIQVLGGCLCYMRLEGSADVWSFNKKNDSSGGSFNEKEEDSSNWSLAGTLQSERDCGKDFLALTKNGEILYWDDEKTYLSYNLRTESIKELLNDVTTGLDVFETIRHEYSFVSLEALGEENVRMFGRIN